jgi:CRP-like cAMP-binding protein
MVTADADGTVRTSQFFDSRQAITDPVSFLTGRPSDQRIEAVEPTVLLAIPREPLMAAYEEDHAIERFGRLLVEEALIGTQLRASRLLNLSVEERYETFMRTRPEVARRLPQYLIASYLGVTPEALSRIRGRIARGR